jgi:hypothetical protein
MPTLREEQIKKTKTILRVAIKHENFFAALASTNARRRKYQEKKNDLSLAIGE